MALVIQPLSTVVASPSAGLSTVALNQTATGNTGAASAVVQPASSPTDSPALSNALKALSTTSKLGGDLQAVATALAPSMQKIVEERPDLATAAFDFQSDNGTIKVVSSSLSDSDKAWLQQTLNANQSLVDAVQTFHKDATTSYALWADANGQSLTSSDAANVSQLADNTFNFMSMFQRASQAMGQNMDPAGSYTAANGAPINPHQSVNSALGFLVFQKSNQAVLNGTDSYTTSTGRTFYGALKGNFLGEPGVIPAFMPAMASNSLGLDATA